MGEANSVCGDLQLLLEACHEVGKSLELEVGEGSIFDVTNEADVDSVIVVCGC